jgi:hypothetical protein
LPCAHQGASDDDLESSLDLATPPGKHVLQPGEALVVKEAAKGHVTGPWTRTRSPVWTFTATTSPGKHVVGPEEVLAIKEAANSHKNLRHGMALLQEHMAVPGTTAFCFALTMDEVDPEDNWANAYGIFVATLFDESMALAPALAPETAAQAYLTLNLKTTTFLVVHGPRQWASTPLSSSSNEGHFMAFKGETLQDGKPPDLWRFKGDNDMLFELAPLTKTVLSLVAQFYQIPGKKMTNGLTRPG